MVGVNWINWSKGWPNIVLCRHEKIRKIHKNATFSLDAIIISYYQTLQSKYYIYLRFFQHRCFVFTFGGWWRWISMIYLTKWIWINGIRNEIGICIHKLKSLHTASFRYGKCWKNWIVHRNRFLTLMNSNLKKNTTNFENIHFHNYVNVLFYFIFSYQSQNKHINI